METSKLERFNHWWINKEVDPELALPFKRDVYLKIGGYLKERFIIALVGLRRVGKTTIMYQLIQKLIVEGVKVENIFFFSFDDVAAKLDDAIETYKEMQQRNFREERIYVFLDEIQKCNNWENEIKKYYDIYPKLKFIISGSESLFIRKKTKETLAGRIFEFMLGTFTFEEYLKLSGVKRDEFKYETKVRPFFLRFAERGGFPETFSFERETDFKEYIRTLVVDRIIYKDIPKSFKIEDPEFLGTLLELIATNPGMYIDYQSLSRQFGKDRRVIKDYIFYLKESFLITLLGNYRKGSITTLRKKKRAYPTDNALIYLYKPKIDETFFGRMIETIIVNKVKAACFWKNGNEVDIIYENMPIEVKYQEKINAEDFKPLREFMRKFGKREGMIITKHEEKQIDVEEGRIKLIPILKWLLLDAEPK